MKFLRAIRRTGYIILTLAVPLVGLAAIGVVLLTIGAIPSGAADQGASSGNSMAGVLVPGVFSLLLSLALMLGSTALISGLADEKESRLIEVLFSSVSVRQLLVGKVLAMGVAGLLQVAIWLISFPVLLNLASSTIGGFISTIPIPPYFALLGVIYFILGYLLFAVLSIGLGAISTSVTDGNQLSMIYIMTSFIPLWFFALLNFFPDSPVWVILSIFPVTAPIQVMVRLGVSTIPLWQILTSIGVLAVSVITGMTVSIKVFRLYMLMSGKRPSLGEIYRGLKNT